MKKLKLKQNKFRKASDGHPAPWIKKLAGLPRGVVNDHEKADILLVAARKKPAAMAEFLYPPRADSKAREQSQRIIKAIFRGLEFHYQLKIRPRAKNKRTLTTYSYIAKNKATLKRLLLAAKEKNERTRRLQLGKLLGYPTTASKAFAEGKAIDIRKLPFSVRKKVEFRFLQFRLSKNWRKELAYVRRRASAVKLISPELYHRIAPK